jgi:predicted O-methyltransferase YrrM
VLRSLLSTRARRRNDRGAASTTRRADAALAEPPVGVDYYGGVAIGAETIGARALDAGQHNRCLETLEKLEPDQYLEYVRWFVAAGRNTAGDAWRYADIVTVLGAAAELLDPASYLEIGIRRGRSMAIVGSRVPDACIVGIDLWQRGYAGMENPGENHVRRELAAVGHRGTIELISGNSHEVLPRLFAERPDLTFDLMTVDGDHSDDGAAQDLADVLPRLRIGGALVFDDLRHPAHPGLHDVWRRTLAADRRYSTWQFDDIGYGVAVAVRRW